MCSCCWLVLEEGAVYCLVEEDRRGGEVREGAKEKRVRGQNER